MKLKEYLNEGVAHEAMRKWGKDLLKGVKGVEIVNNMIFIKTK